jgi:hypothetical protein
MIICTINISYARRLHFYDGILRKAKKKEEKFEPIISARLNSKEAFAFKYGQLEVRAKVPEGDWIWPGRQFHRQWQLV